MCPWIIPHTNNITKQVNHIKQINITYLIFHRLTAGLEVFCSLKNGITPEDFDVVFCQNKYSDLFNLLCVWILLDTIHFGLENTCKTDTHSLSMIQVFWDTRDESGFSLYSHRCFRAKQVLFCFVLFVFCLRLSLTHCISEKWKCADVFCIRHRIKRQTTQLKERSCSETRWPCSPRQQWCRQPALGYRQPSTERNKQPTEWEN